MAAGVPLPPPHVGDEMSCLGALAAA